MSRRVYLLGVGLALVAGAFAATHELLGPWPGATEANVRRIRKGMTLEQVEAILGGKGSWGNRPPTAPIPSPTGDGWGMDVLGGGESGLGGRKDYYWVGPDGYAHVAFSWSFPGEAKRVRQARFWRATPLSLFQRLRTRLGW